MDTLEMIRRSPWFYGYGETAVGRGSCIGISSVMTRLNEALMLNHESIFYEWEDSLAAACELSHINAGWSSCNDCATAAIYHAHGLEY